MNNTQAIAAMTNEEAIKVLAEVKAYLGRNYKRAIRAAWMNGNYEAKGLGSWSSRLQQIRNTFGPSWLVAARPNLTLRREQVMAKHTWHSMNREVHGPEDLTVEDMAEELKCAMAALPEESFVEFVKLIDQGKYAEAAIYFEDGLNRLD